MMLPAAVTMIPNYLVWNWLRQFFLGLPRERFEAARVDGTSYLQLFWRITLPRGLKVNLDQFGQGGEAQWEVVLAASVIATLPMLVIFFIGQRYFVAGIATTGRKG